jgi:excisionase family DNA binding protein
MAFVRPEVTGKSSGSAAFRPAAWRITDGAQQLGISRSSIYKLVARGQIRTITIAGRHVIPDSEIMRLASGGTPSEAA